MTERRKSRLLYGIQISIMTWVLFTWIKNMYIFKAWFNIVCLGIILHTLYCLIRNLYNTEKIYKKYGEK